MVCQARAKINWSIDILSRREDGFHELDMLMQSIELCDEITFEPARWLKLSVDGQWLPVGSKNLVMRAANALNEYMGRRNGANIMLKKRIPVRAGLGGGSADCACTLVALNKLWKLHLPVQKLMEIGAGIGSDVPFLIEGGLARAQHTGTTLTKLPCRSGIPLVLKMAGDGLSTAAVYQNYDQLPVTAPHLDIPALADAIYAGDIEAAARLSGNHLEAPAISLLPQVAQVMDQLRANGAKFVRMSGSGSCVFGAFDTDEQAQAAAGNIPGSIFTRTADSCVVFLDK